MTAIAAQGGRRVELQTVAVAAAVYGGWLAIVLWNEAVSWPVSVVLLAVVIAWPEEEVVLDNPGTFEEIGRAHV